MNAILLVGGPEFDIQVDGKIYHFEMHRYCGPTWLNKRGDPRSVQPLKFLHAASQWAKQGQKVENGLCVWHHEAKPILEQIVGRHYRQVGEYPPEQGV